MDVEVSTSQKSVPGLSGIKMVLKSFFYLDMGHFVVVEVAGSGEPLAADPTLVRLLTAVDSSMGVEAGRGGESLVANVAHVRTFAGVDSNVAFQETGSVEGLAAEVARQHVLLPATDDADIGVRRR